MSVVWHGEGEQARRTSKREKALQALEQAGAAGVLNVDLMRIAGTRAGSRVQELRDQGHVITCDHVRDGVYRYVLHAQSTPRPGQPGFLASLPAVASITGRRLTPATEPPADPAATGRLF